MRDSVKSEETFAAMIQKRQPRAIDVSQWSDVQIKDAAREAVSNPQTLETLLLALREQSRGRAALEVMLDGAIKASVTDPLTGIHNRRSFFDRLQNVIDEDVRYGDRQAGIIFIDLDRFKAINDTYGHAAGDAVLVAVGQYLKRNTRSHEMAARLGGDEFVVLLIDRRDEGFPTVPFNRIDRGINNLVVDFKGRSIRVGASLGLVRFDANTLKQCPTAEALMEAADLRMYDIKKNRNPAVTK